MKSNASSTYFPLGSFDEALGCSFLVFPVNKGTKNAALPSPLIKLS